MEEQPVGHPRPAACPCCGAATASGSGSAEEVLGPASPDSFWYVLGMKQQLALPTLCPVTEAVERLAESGGVEERGAVFTRREVVDFILDLSGYTPDRPLHTMRLLEPSVGEGDFLIPIVDRLLAAQRHFAPGGDPVADLSDAIRVVELSRSTLQAAKARLHDHLAVQHGLQDGQAADLCQAWLVQGDFLLVDLGSKPFHFVVGNPPYVRIEQIPVPLQDEYRRRYNTIYDRADLYVAFVERGLNLLVQGGVLGYIVSDRWAKNKYGGPLREKVSSGFHLRHYVDMVDTPAFLSDVIAYPAVFVIAREPDGPTTVAHRPQIDADHLKGLAQRLLGHEPGAIEVSGVMSGSEPWMLEEFERLAVVRRLEATFPTIEEVGCSVGIGVATGADKVFIASFDALDVEDDRKLPLVTTKDIKTGALVPRGLGVINPFEDEGGLVDLKRYPRLAAYFEKHRADIQKRHVAQKNKDGWYRTIDRITPSLTYRPKLLIPDIKGSANVVYEPGQHYPHHNLYYMISDEWDLQALRAVLLSAVAELFIATYSVKMRGDYLRYQAQYLRRIRLPRWADVPAEQRAALIEAGQSGDLNACDAAAFKVYGLSVEEQAILTR